MVLIQLTGKITENGKLEVDLPEGLPPGDVQVTIEMPVEEAVLIDEEIAELIQPKPIKSGAEIVARLEAEGGWEDLGINDGAEWVQEQRRKK